jgi:hypothetical protein
MDQAEAVRAVATADETERDERAARLVELVRLLGDDTIGFSGQAASWLFEDVKATWLYGYFTATVVTAHAFCLRQLAGLMLLLPDDPEMPDAISSLEELAAACHERGLVDLDLRARLVALHDACAAYTTVGLQEQDQRLERRLLDAEVVGGDEHPLSSDARSALDCCVALLHRR